jgi:hypothetical protein
VSVFPDNGAQTPVASTFFPVPEAAHPVTLPSVMVKTLVPVPPLHAATAPGLRITPWEERRLDFGPSSSQMSVPVATPPSNGPPAMRQLKNPTKIEWPCGRQPVPVGGHQRPDKSTLRTPLGRLSSAREQQGRVLQLQSRLDAEMKTWNFLLGSPPPVSQNAATILIEPALRERRVRLRRLTSTTKFVCDRCHTTRLLPTTCGCVVSGFVLSRGSMRPVRVTRVRLTAKRTEGPARSLGWKVHMRCANG